MADDDLDYAFGQFGDVNPPGTMTGLGLGPNDPLYDWGSNMRPADLAQYVHNPEAFKQAMINSGQAPPNHNYAQGANGQLQPVDQHNLPIVRTTEQGRIQGNLSDYLNPPRQTAAQAVAPPGQPSQALGFQAFPGGTSEGASPPPPQAPPGTVYVPGQGWVQRGTPPAAPAAPPPAPAGPRRFDWSPGGGGEGGGALNPPDYIPESKPLPKLRNPSEVPEGTTPLPRSDPRRVAPADIRPEVAEGAPAAQPGSTPAERAKEKKVEALSSEAMSDFAKSLQGVKMPQRPAWQPMGAPAVRSPVGIQPQIQTLLAAIGQGRPSPQQVALMRLLGRA